MAKFSGLGAVTAGWRIILREPLAFGVWCLVYFAVAVVPQVVAFRHALPAFFQLMRSMGDGTPLTPEEIVRFQGEAASLQPVTLLAFVVSNGLVASAIFRAVLTPQDRRYFYLRMGGQELWVGLVVLVLGVAYAMGVFVMAIPVGLLGALAAAAGAAALLPLLVLAAVGVAVWAVLRLSMAPPASFDKHTFAFFESWAMTRGQAARMFVVGVALFLNLLAVEFLLAAIGMAAVGGSSGVSELVGVWSANPQAALANTTPLSWAALGLAVTVFGTFGQALFWGAWAEIYRGLAGKAAD
ncbi:MAG: hypothetical protein ACJ8CX_07340 [Microvirga sp.]